ncbi:hypothetical protein EBZ02_06935 [bacterium]|nr:hypothetical protein [bacterium]
MKITVSKKEFLRAIRTMGKTAEKGEKFGTAVLRWDREARRLAIEFGNCGWELAAQGDWPEEVKVYRVALEKFTDPAQEEEHLDLEIKEGNLVAGGQTLLGLKEWNVDSPLKKKMIPGQGAVQALTGLALPEMRKPEVFAFCQDVVAGAEMGHTLWCRGGKWRLEFQMYIRKRNVRYPVVLEAREKPDRLVLTAISRDVERAPGDTWPLTLVGKMWKADHPKSPYRLIFRRDRMMIRHSFRYRRAWESGNFYQKFWEELIQLNGAMRYLFPTVAMNDTLIARAAHRWPDAKRLEIP